LQAADWRSAFDTVMDKVGVPVHYSEMSGYLDGFARYPLFAPGDPGSCCAAMSGLVVAIQVDHSSGSDWSMAQYKLRDLFKYCSSAENRQLKTLDVGEQSLFPFVALNVTFNPNFKYTQWTLFPLSMKSALLEFVDRQCRLKDPKFETPLDVWEHVSFCVKNCLTKKTPVAKQAAEAWNCHVQPYIVNAILFTMNIHSKNMFNSQSRFIKAVHVHSYAGPHDLGSLTPAFLKQLASQQQQQQRQQEDASSTASSEQGQAGKSGRTRTGRSRKRTEKKTVKDLKAIVDKYQLRMEERDSKTSVYDVWIYYLKHPHEIIGDHELYALTVIQKAQQQSGDDSELAMKLAYFRLQELEEFKQQAQAAGTEPDFSRAQYKDVQHVLDDHARSLAQREFMRSRGQGKQMEGRWAGTVLNSFFGYRALVTSSFYEPGTQKALDQIVAHAARRVTAESMADFAGGSISAEALMKLVESAIAAQAEEPAAACQGEAVPFDKSEAFVQCLVYEFFSDHYSDAAYSVRKLKRDLAVFVELGLAPAGRHFISKTRESGVFKILSLHLSELDDRPEEAGTGRYRALLAAAAADWCGPEQVLSDETVEGIMGALKDHQKELAKAKSKKSHKKRR